MEDKYKLSNGDVVKRIKGKPCNGCCFHKRTSVCNCHIPSEIQDTPCIKEDKIFVKVKKENNLKVTYIDNDNNELSELIKDCKVKVSYTLELIELPFLSGKDSCGVCFFCTIKEGYMECGKPEDIPLHCVLKDEQNDHYFKLVKE